MSDKNQARRARAEITFDGADITADIKPYLISLSYTDNEEDEADDLQITVEDRDDVWMSEWLGEMIDADANNADAGSSVNVETTTYTYNGQYNAQRGLWCRTGASTRYSTIGYWEIGDSYEVYAVIGNWAIVDFNGELGYSYAPYLTKSEGGAQTISQVSYGSENDSVKLMQQMLKDLGYDLGSGGVSGKFDTATLSAVKQFQEKYCKWVDGICGPNTFGQLYQQTAKAASEQKANMPDATKGLSISAVFIRENWNSDGKDKKLKTGSFELDSVKASGPPGVVTIKGTSLFYSSAARQTEKTQAWEQYTLSGIGAEVAGRAGLSFRYDSKSNPYYKRVEQDSQSDISFVIELAHRAGISVKIYDNTLILFDQEDYERKAPVRTFKRGDKSYEKWDLETGESEIKYGYCKVYYKNPQTKAVYTGYAYAEDYDQDTSEGLIINQRVESTAEARTLAAKMLRLKNKFEYTVKLTIPGDPDMVAGVTVKMDGWGMFSGKYLIKQSKHTLSRSSGYSTQITLRKVFV